MKNNWPQIPERAIDAHCHFFNRKLLSLRLLMDLISVLNKKELQPASLSAEADIKRILNFLKTGMSSINRIYHLLEADEKGFAFCPLMFDLEMCIKSEGNIGTSDLYFYQDQIFLKLKEAEEKLKEWKELHSFLGDCLNDNISLENSFWGQERQLADLVLKYPDRIFPFFAVDPRRKELFDDPERSCGIQKIVSKLRRNGGAFSGIKLYTPNGYSPMDVRLMELYLYCEQYGVPITAHCSGGGFATFEHQIQLAGEIYRNGKVESFHGCYNFTHNGLFDLERVTERAVLLNHPAIWEKLLRKFPHLKLNLAHFGLQESGKWTKYIWRMMQVYPNLYTDFSCVTEKRDLQWMYSNYYRLANVEVKTRFLYGSDFYLNLLFTDSIAEFLSHFSELFSSDEWTDITRNNPQRFLQMIE